MSDEHIMRSSPSKSDGGVVLEMFNDESNQAHDNPSAMTISQGHTSNLPSTEREDDMRQTSPPEANFDTALHSMVLDPDASAPVDGETDESSTTSSTASEEKSNQSVTGEVVKLSDLVSDLAIVTRAFERRVMHSTDGLTTLSGILSGYSNAIKTLLLADNSDTVFFEEDGKFVSFASDVLIEAMSLAKNKSEMITSDHEQIILALSTLDNVLNEHLDRSAAPPNNTPSYPNYLTFGGTGGGWMLKKVSQDRDEDKTGALYQVIRPRGG